MPTAGPNGPSTGVNNASSGSTAWTNPGNITASDATYATCGLSSGGTSQYLVGTTFGFSIPSTATIVGIEVDWQRKSGLGDIKDSQVRIMKGGVIGTTDRSSASAWPTSEAYRSYGGASDLWGLTWLYSDINSSTFGAALLVTSTGSDQASVDYVRITITYTLPTGLVKNMVSSQAKPHAAFLE